MGTKGDDVHPPLCYFYGFLMGEILVSPVGFEPTTNGLKVHCSTAELQAPDAE